MKVNPDIFKANDIRGIYPDALDDAVAYAIGRAFVTLLKVNAVVVGRDMRLSSPPMFDALTQGLMDGGRMSSTSVWSARINITTPVQPLIRLA